MRALLWVQHLLGTGHVVRTVAIARALEEAGAAVTLVLGATPPPHLDLSGFDIVALPSVSASDASFRTIQAPDGTPYADLAPERERLIGEAIETRSPHIVLVETFPFGRRPFAAELRRPLAAARAKGALIASSIRDVLQRRSPDKERAMANLAIECCALVLVHSDPRVVPLDASFAQTPAIAPLVHYTGYVDGLVCAPRDPLVDQHLTREGVVVSAGGSDVGAALLWCAVRAAALCDRALPFRILVPPKLGGCIAPWRQAAGPNVTLEPNRGDFRALLASAALSVSQAGYNTVIDVLGAGPRMLLVPFAAFEETEQTDRAAALSAHNRAAVIEEVALSPERLAAAITAMLRDDPPAPLALDRDGARRSAAILMARAG